MEPKREERDCPVCHKPMGFTKICKHCGVACPVHYRNICGPETFNTQGDDGFMYTQIKENGKMEW